MEVDSQWSILYSNQQVDCGPGTRKPRCIAVGCGPWTMDYFKHFNTWKQ